MDEYAIVRAGRQTLLNGVAYQAFDPVPLTELRAIGWHTVKMLMDQGHLTIRPAGEAGF